MSISACCGRMIREISKCMECLGVIDASHGWVWCASEAMSRREGREGTKVPLVNTTSTHGMALVLDSWDVYKYERLPANACRFGSMVRLRRLGRCGQACPGRPEAKKTPQQRRACAVAAHHRGLLYSAVPCQHVCLAWRAVVAGDNRTGRPVVDPPSALTWTTSELNSHAPTCILIKNEYNNTNLTLDVACAALSKFPHIVARVGVCW